MFQAGNMFVFTDGSDGAIKSVSLHILGDPKPYKGQRYVHRSNHTYNASCSELAAFRTCVQGIMRDNCTSMDQPTLFFNEIELGLEVHLKFILQRPKKHFIKCNRSLGLKDSSPQLHTQKPDMDNLTKFILDGLNGLIYSDDRIIVRIDSSKVWGPHGSTEISVRRCS